MTAPATAPVAGPTMSRAALAGTGLFVATVFGMLLPARPMAALGLIVLAPLAFWAPTASLVLLLALTVLVPFEIQDRLAVVGGRETPSVLIVDAVLVLGLCRVAWLVVRQRLEATAPLVLAGALMVVLAAAALLGVVNGFDTSEAGHEARRVALGVGAFLLAWPLLQVADARRRLGPALLVLGSLLGAWGLVQWLWGIDYTTGGDVGVRAGVPFTSSGRGQLQGGLFAYPVAVTLAFAALVSMPFRSTSVRLWVGVVLALNAACLLLTYERTFWAAAALGCLIVVAASEGGLRRLMARVVPISTAVVAVAVAAVLSGEYRIVLERLVSVSRYRTDIAVEYRVEEARAVLDAIGQQPLIGSGFGSTITWGKPGVFGTITTPFAHNGYLWLVWKIGLPAAVLVSGAMALAVVRRRRVREEPLLGALRTGSRAAVVGLLLVNMTFPVFDALGVTAAVGFLVAVSLCPPGLTPDREPRSSPPPAHACTPGPTRH